MENEINNLKKLISEKNSPENKENEKKEMINEIKNKLNLKEQIKDILLDNEIKDNLLKYFEEKMSDNYINKKEIINIIELKEKEINDKLDERHERHKDLESKINNNLINIKFKRLKNLFLIKNFDKKNYNIS